MRGAWVFGAALLLRLVVGGLTFGSIDLTNSIENSFKLVCGQRVVLPYLPFVPLLVWIGGLLAASTPLLLPLCFKLIPILCDSLLAWLLYGWTLRVRPSQARLVGFLYAAAPVPLIITSIHAQWDAITLLFLASAVALRDEARPNLRRDFAVGAIFGLACVAKPYPLMLAPVVLLPSFVTWKTGPRFFLRRTLAAGLGAVVVFAAAFGLAAAAGYDMGAQLGKIFGYADVNVQIFGLPFLKPFRDVQFLWHHVWTVPFLLGLAVPYHLGRATSLRSVVAILCFVLGVSGLGPQYLMWPSALLLAEGLFWEAGAVSLLGTVFLILYYLNPAASRAPMENMGAFATLRGATWLMPGRVFGEAGDMQAVRLLGDLVQPLLFLAITARLLVPAARGERPTLPLRLTLLPPAVVALVVAPLGAYAAYAKTTMHLGELWERLYGRLSQYAVQTGSYGIVIALNVKGGFFSLPRLLFVLALVTTLVCFRVKRTRLAVRGQRP